MVNIIFQKVMSEEEAEKATGLKYLELPDEWFIELSSGKDLNNDEYFKKVLLEIDECDVPMPNVARLVLNGDTHSFDKVSTGVRMLWLMKYYPNKFLYPSQWLGQNCYKALFELGEENEIMLYEDSGMMDQTEIDECVGLKFRDYHNGNIVELGQDVGFLYTCDMGY
jgi:hypothetical protein